MEAGIYASVSTHDQHTLGMQVEALSIFAEFEREILRERVKAGIAHSRNKGKPHGRPATVKKYSKEVITLFKSGLSQSEIARTLKIGRTSVRRG